MFYESVSTTDYRYLPINFSYFSVCVLGKAFYVDNSAPWAVFSNLQTFICGYGDNWSTGAIIRVVCIGV